MTVTDSLAICFARLNQSRLDRLEWHRKKGTRVLCGNKAGSYIDCKGGG